MGNIKISGGGLTGGAYNWGGWNEEGGGGLSFQFYFVCVFCFADDHVLSHFLVIEMTILWKPMIAGIILVVSIIPEINLKLLVWL